jgi:DNA-binding NarL/FixJ family response regulator
MVRLSDTDTNNYDRLLRYKNNLSNQNKSHGFPDNLPSNETSVLPVKDDDTNERVVSQLQKKQKKLSKEEVQQLIADYKSGLSVKQLANKFGCYRITVSRKLKAAGVTIRHMPPTDSAIDRMVELYQSGLSLNDVSRQVKRSAKTVKKYIALRDVKIRS